MAKVYIMCGKICSGKSTYSRKLRDEHRAVILSVDEITLALFGQDAGDKLDYYVERTEEYLYAKSLEIVSTGIDVVLDWGFWKRSEREYARDFYSRNGIVCEFHYIDIDPDEWRRRIAVRNEAVLDHKSDAYYVDDGLAAKFEAIFEKPDRDEIDVWVDARD
ncbi:MAG: ATP-binding protein [Oscillospiraceae bacterium]|nr:ATP-binding protein [Oscillospiraceae bacterium]